MKKLLTFLPIFLLLGAISSNAQVFWTENFTGGSTGLDVSSYTGPNGAWTLMTSISTAEGDTPNPWYVSCQEAGHTAGACGSVCGTGDLGASLHVGANAGSLIPGDNGASYDAGGLCGTFYCTTTDRRAVSPTINCTGKSGINLRFYYIENGDGANDDGFVEYYDGTTWALLTNTAKTTVCGSGQGQWAVVNITLPASANNNPNVKIGFRWVNNDDGVGTDPSYAIDSVSLSIPTTGTAPVASYTSTATTACVDSCITFTSTSTGSPTDYSWTAVGATVASSTSSSTSICFPASGAYSVTLTATNGSGSNSTTTVINVTPTPHPTITQTGAVLSVPPAYTSYQWFNGTTPIIGANTYSVTITTTSLYGVLVDSAGCPGGDTLTTGPLHVTNLHNAAGHYWVAQPNTTSIIVNSSNPLDDELSVTIFDATGREILSEKWNAGSYTKQINGLFVASGLYIIKISNSYTSSVLKWLKP